MTNFEHQLNESALNFPLNANFEVPSITFFRFLQSPSTLRESLKPLGRKPSQASRFKGQTDKGPKVEKNDEEEEEQAEEPFCEEEIDCEQCRTSCQGQESCLIETGEQTEEQFASNSFALKHHQSLKPMLSIASTDNRVQIFNSDVRST